MRAQDITQIANAVVENLGGSMDASLLGCGAVSSTEAYSTDDQYACQEYECGGLAQFSCCQGFNCLDLFSCPGAALYGCYQEQFMCLQEFGCEANYAAEGGVCSR
jgi:hypothetical protein